MNHVERATFLLCAALLLAAAPAMADPIAVTSGRIILAPMGAVTTIIDITAPGLRILQDEIEDQPILVAPLPSPVTGALMDLSAFTVNGSGPGGIIVGTLGDGTSVRVAGPMAFHAGSALLTCRSEFVRSSCESAPAPFTFEAHFTLTTDRGDVFARDLIGRGTVMGHFTAREDLFDPFEVLTYTFASPTPEPATLMLLGTGAAALPVLRRRRRTRTDAE